MRILISCLLGLEAFVSQELQEQGFVKEDIEVHDGRVYINNLSTIDKLSRAVAVSNIYCRCAERVYIELMYEKVNNFDTLFDKVQAYPWEVLIKRGSSFIVDRGYSRKSQLYGVTAAQGMIKKAIVRHLLAHYDMSEDDILAENLALGEIKLHFSFMSDMFSLCVDTSGEGLHKRSYRTEAGLAPIKETLAASLVYQAKYKPFSEECLYDPFCGSGTVVIEAAQIAANIAPGLKRKFSYENFEFLNQKICDEVKKEALNKVDDKLDEAIIFASDIDEKVLQAAKRNAERAGVSDMIHFFKADACDLNLNRLREEFRYDKILIVSNPPYGERMSDETLIQKMFRRLSSFFFSDKGIQKNLRLTLISSDLSLESCLGFIADKRRKLYNGMIVCMVYQFFKENGHVCKKTDINYTNVKKLSTKKRAFSVKESKDSVEKPELNKNDSRSFARISEKNVKISDKFNNKGNANFSTVKKKYNNTLNINKQEFGSGTKSKGAFIARNKKPRGFN